MGPLALRLKKMATSTRSWLQNDKSADEWAWIDSFVTLDQNMCHDINSHAHIDQHRVMASN